MRKALLILAAAAIVAAPTTGAMAKHRRHHITVHAPTPDPNPFQPGWRAFWTGFDTILFVPIRTTLGIPSPWG